VEWVNGGMDNGPVRYLVRNGVALCPEGEALVTPGRLKNGTYPCGHERFVTVALRYHPVMLMRVYGKEKRERRRITKMDLCEACWERTRARLESAGAYVVAKWRKAG